MFKEPHFGKNNVPKFLDDKRLGKYKMLLWHMDWIKSNTTEIYFYSSKLNLTLSELQVGEGIKRR